MFFTFENGKQAGNSLGTMGKWKNLGNYVHKIFMGMRMKRKCPETQARDCALNSSS